MSQLLNFARHGLIGLVCALTVATTATAQSVTLAPVADAFVTPGSLGSLSNNNYGGAGALGIAAPGLSAGQFDSVIRFDTAGTKATFDTLYGAGQWSLSTAILTLTTTAPNNALFNSPNTAGLFTISYTPNSGWTEGTGTPSVPQTTGITFNTLPTFTSNEQALGNFNYITVSSGTAANYSLGLASGFRNAVNTGSLLGLHLAAADGVISYLFNSRSFATVAARPSLVLTATAAVPEPSSLLLGIIALGSALVNGVVRGERRSHTVFLTGVAACSSPA